MVNGPGARPAANRFALTSLSAGVKVLVSCLWVVVLGLTAFMVAIAAGTPNAPRAAVIFSIVFAFALVVPITISLLSSFRYGAWLEGTTLAVRRMVTTRRCDLAISPVSLDSYLGVPRLTARHAVTGRPVRLVLGHPFGKTILPAPKLLALADAIAAGGRQDHGAWHVAAELRARAAAVPSTRPGQR